MARSEFRGPRGNPVNAEPNPSPRDVLVGLARDRQGIQRTRDSHAELAETLTSPQAYKNLDTSGTMEGLEKNAKLGTAIEIMREVNGAATEHFDNRLERTDEAILSLVPSYDAAVKESREALPKEPVQDVDPLEQVRSLVARGILPETALPSQEQIAEIEAGRAEEALERKILRDDHKALLALPGEISGFADELAEVRSGVPKQKAPAIVDLKLQPKDTSEVADPTTAIEPDSATALRKALTDYAETHPGQSFNQEDIDGIVAAFDAQNSTATVRESDTPSEIRPGPFAGAPRVVHGEYLRVTQGPTNLDSPNTTVDDTPVREHHVMPPTRGEDYEPLVRADSDTGLITLSNGNVIRPGDIPDKVRALFLMIPDEIDMHRAQTPHALARQLTDTFGEPIDAKAVHALKYRANQVLNQYGVRIPDYDPAAGGYYRTVSGRPTAEITPVSDFDTDIDAPATTETSAPAGIRTPDIASLAGILNNPQLQSKFSAIEGLFDSEALADLQRSVDLGNVDKNEHALGALARVAAAMENPEQFRDIVQQTYDQNTHAGEVLTALEVLNEVRVGTNGDRMTGLEYLALAIANPDVDVAVTISDSPEHDLTEGQPVTPEAPKPRPVELRDPEIRERLSGYFGSIEGLRHTGATAAEIEEALGHVLTSRKLEKLSRLGVVRPFRQDNKDLYRHADIAALLYLDQVAVPGRYASSMRSDVLKIAQEMHEERQARLREQREEA